MTRAFVKGDVIQSRRFPQNGTRKVTRVDREGVHVKGDRWSGLLGNLDDWELAPVTLFPAETLGVTE